MTALTRYARLETMGRWRPGLGEAEREVVVSFGDATLVLTDGNGQPLTHWSLPAVVRLNPGGAPAVFGPDRDGHEALEVEDELMVEAIETVRSTVARDESEPWKLRRWMGWLVLLLVVGAAVAWAPGALRRETMAVLPASKQTEIGATLLGHLQRSLGPACRDPLGADALARLTRRTLGPEAQAVVLPLGPDAPIRLPGNITVLSRAAVERAAEPAVVAGQLLAARVAEPDPMGHLLDRAGAWTTMGLLTSGDIEPGTLESQAEALLAAPAKAPDDTVLGPAFAAAEVPLTPYALDLDPSGTTVGALIEADAYAGEVAPLIISDSEWVALQGICRGQ